MRQIVRHSSLFVILSLAFSLSVPPAYAGTDSSSSSSSSGGVEVSLNSDKEASGGYVLGTDPNPGFYIGLFGGGGASNNDPITQKGTAFITSPLGPLVVNARGNADSHSAGMGGVHIGYEWRGWELGNPGSGWGILPALEFEGFYLGTTQTGTLNNPTPRVQEHRFFDSFSLDTGVVLANAVFTLQTPSRFRPYIGVGLGAALVSVSGADSLQESPPEPGINHFNSNPTAIGGNLAAQLKVGAHYEFTSHWSAFVEYRLLFINNTSYFFGSTVYPGIHAPTSPWKVGFGDMFFNLGVAGVDYRF
ncbi:MAG: porin family protein [Acidobacteriia bacterium]|nr:outer membrane beta-barrel protein [Methyloceanibacter sp.]MCL6491700.1 porin family protein [Terriglobia bacterium]